MLVLVASVAASVSACGETRQDPESVVRSWAEAYEAFDARNVCEHSSSGLIRRMQALYVEEAPLGDSSPAPGTCGDKLIVRIKIVSEVEPAQLRVRDVDAGEEVATVQTDGGDWVLREEGGDWKVDQAPGLSAGE
jgi:hypothetical protein